MNESQTAASPVASAPHVIQAPGPEPGNPTGSVSSRDEVAMALAKLAQSFTCPQGHASTASAALEATVACLPGFEEATVFLVDRDQRASTAAATSEVARSLDDLQRQLRQGPLVDVLAGAPLVSAPDLRVEQRWPLYVRSALASAGPRSQVAVPLPGRHGRPPLGAINLYSRHRAHAEAEVIALAPLLASHVALALSAAHRVAQFDKALETRSLIGQAIGVLMARHGLTAEVAMSYLTRVSSHSNLKVRDLAARIVAHPQESFGSDGHV